MSQLITLEFKRGTSTDWATINPILAPGEPGFEVDTGKMKVGDGVLRWNELAYVSALSTVDGSIKLGQNAGLDNQGKNSVALGVKAGELGQGYSSVNDGNLIGVTGYSIAIGFRAGQGLQRDGSIAIGSFAGGSSQKNNSIAIGANAGYVSQGSNSIAIGTDAGYEYQGSNSIAIGKNAGFGPSNAQASNTIILNASGLEIDGVPDQTNSFYVRPIREDLTKTVPLMYDPSTYEIVQGTMTIGPTGNTGPTGVNGVTGPTGINSTTGSWTLSTGANTKSLTVPLNGTYSIWVRGNIPNGIVSYTATVVVSNDNVPVVGTSYGWYYSLGGPETLVLTAIPNQIVGTLNSISSATAGTIPTNQFTFGITNNSGTSQIVYWGYITL